MNRNQIDFTARMDEGRALAQDRRNKGLPTGKSAAGWNVKRRPMDAEQREYAVSWAWLCEETHRDWRNEKSKFLNDFAAACLNGPGWKPISTNSGRFNHDRISPRPTRTPRHRV
jgi:hypothetical protein